MGTTGSSPTFELFVRAIRECRVIEFEYEREWPPGGVERRSGIPIDYGAFRGLVGDRYHILFRPSDEGGLGDHIAGIGPTRLRSMSLLDQRFEPTTIPDEHRPLRWRVSRSW